MNTSVTLLNQAFVGWFAMTLSQQGLNLELPVSEHRVTVLLRKMTASDVSGKTTSSYVKTKPSSGCRDLISGWMYGSIERRTWTIVFLLVTTTMIVS